MVDWDAAVPLLFRPSRLLASVFNRIEISMVHQDICNLIEARDRSGAYSLV
jgi:hypothetical protein